MPIRFPCGSCGERLVVRVEFANRHVRCPACKTALSAPATSAADPDGLVILAEKPGVPLDFAPITGRKKMRWPWIAAVAIVLLSLAGGAVIYFVPFFTPTERLLSALPPGEAVIIIAKDSEIWPIPKPEGVDDFIDHTILKRSGGANPGTLSMTRGKFDVAKVKAALLQKGFEEKNVEGEMMLVRGAVGCAVLSDRIYRGTIGLVQEGVRVSRGENSFLHALSKEKRAVLVQVKKAAMIYYSPGPNWDGDLFVTAFRSMDQKLPPSNLGMMGAIEKEPESFALKLTLVFGCSDGAQAADAERSAALLADGLTTRRKDNLVIATGMVTPTPWRIVENERAAVAALRAIVDVEKRLLETEKAYWTADVSGLHRRSGTPAARLDAGIAAADRKPLREGDSKGLLGRDLAAQSLHSYYFEALEKDESGVPYRQDRDFFNSNRFGFVAYTINYGVEGRRTFIVDARSFVYAKDIPNVANGSVTQMPLEPLKDGWKLVE